MVSKQLPVQVRPAGGWSRQSIYLTKIWYWYSLSIDESAKVILSTATRVRKLHVSGIWLLASENIILTSFGFGSLYGHKFAGKRCEKCKGKLLRTHFIFYPKFQALAVIGHEKSNRELSKDLFRCWRADHLLYKPVCKWLFFIGANVKILFTFWLKHRKK